MAFAQAEFLVDKIDNDHWKGLLYLRLGFVNRSTCNYLQAREFFIKAEECFGREGRDYFTLSAMLNEGQVYDICGRKMVNGLRKGIYIIDGKKVAVQ